MNERCAFEFVDEFKEGSVISDISISINHKMN